MKLLEIGVGSGGISHHFSTRPDQYEVHAVDVVDGRRVKEGYEFTLVSDSKLPFADRSFDIVISNHVIEHVGDRARQFRHLKEISRVLTEDGVGYLAVPNRWMLIEPHYALPFLSWLPRRFRSSYLALSGRGQVYDCEPLQYHELHALLERAGLDYRHRELEALQVIRTLEPDNRAARLLGLLPGTVVALARPLLPTFICTIGHATHGSSAR